MAQNGARELDLIGLKAMPEGITIKRLTPQDFMPLYLLAVRHFGEVIASFDAVRRMIEFNPESAYAIGRAGADGRLRPMGYVAFLMLNEKGVEALLEGRLNAQDPQYEYLVREGETPAGVYVWGVVATGKAIAGIPQIMDILKQERFRHADIYARPATPAGLQLMKALNFMCLTPAGEVSDRALYVYRRVVNRYAA